MNRDSDKHRSRRTKPHRNVAGGGGVSAPRSVTQKSGQTLKSPDKMPRNFGRYRVIRRLGKGGMGTVFLADDTQLERQVALKVPQFTSSDSEEMLERFYREARAAATLQHPNLCPVFDVGEIDGIHYLTMAYIDGYPLSDALQPGKPMPLGDAVTTVSKLALAMAEAHDGGIVHRDLKPSNIFINKRGEPVVMDFGLARRNDSQDARLTKSGAVLGTPAYMSPEQIKGDIQAIGPQCDIYSLGVILYELVTGELPFDGPIASVLGQALTQEPLAPSSIRKDLDPRLEAICLKMMAKNCVDRYQSMNEVAAALEKTISESSPLEELEEPDFYQIAGKPSIVLKNWLADVTGGSAKLVRRRTKSLRSIPDARKRTVALCVVAAILLFTVSMLAYDYFSGSNDPDGGDVASNVEESINQTDGNSGDGTGETILKLKEITNSIGMKLVLIPAGEFSMGSVTLSASSQQAAEDEPTQQVFDDERPLHVVRITKAFYIGVHEVTQKQYQAIMHTTPAYFLGDSRPVERISWDDAKEFCRLLSREEGVHYRLPTEAEWEYACRAGSKTVWFFGDDEKQLVKYAWSSVNSEGSTSKVGQLKPNRFGLFDVYGNVAEWCQDWYGFTYYGESSTLNPQGPLEEDASKLGYTKVVRGGSFESTKATCRSAYRGTNSMMVRDSKQTGLRIVRVAGDDVVE